MNTKIAIVADFDAESPSHAKTAAAIVDSSNSLCVDVAFEWLPTQSLVGNSTRTLLSAYQGIWIGPGSPYRSMEGALVAIRFAREERVPILGTCGGFQHMVIEYARNVLGIADGDHEESSPNSPRLIISRLGRSLAGRTMNIALSVDSRLSSIYSSTLVREGFLCSFGVNPKFFPVLSSHDLRFVAADEEGEARAIELPNHPFFIGTLFLPQMSSSAARPHPIIREFVQHACTKLF